jgi:ABC-type transporter Mla MlaB component
MEKKKETKIDSLQDRTVETLPESNLIFITKRKLEGENSAVGESGNDSNLSGVYCNGVQYYDLNNILFINNTGLANLISLMKSLLKRGVVVKFVNANKMIKEKIKSFGLEKFINLG